MQGLSPPSRASLAPTGRLRWQARAYTTPAHRWIVKNAAAKTSAGNINTRIRLTKPVHGLFTGIFANLSGPQALLDNGDRLICTSALVLERLRSIVIAHIVELAKLQTSPKGSAQMTRLTAKDFAPELLELYDYYAHGKINRREFLDRAALFTLGGLTAGALLAALSPNYALAEQVEFTDPDIVAEYVTYPSPKGNRQVRGYLVRPANASGKVPAVVVVHENRGLNPYIEDVARRVAKAGFIALAPDGLTSVGGYPGNDDKGRELQATVDPEKLMNDFFAAIEWLMKHDATSGKVGITGFCYGGGVVNAAAVAYPELGAAVSFYGRQPDLKDVPRIKAPLMLHYGELDTRINEGWPAYEKALKAAGKIYEAYIYPGANHGFHNDSTPRYDDAAARLAWDRTLGWFRRYLVQG
jgi:carboxymethylenebutenolidase